MNRLVKLPANTPHECRDFEYLGRIDDFVKWYAEHDEEDNFKIIMEWVPVYTEWHPNLKVHVPSRYGKIDGKAVVFIDTSRRFPGDYWVAEL